MVKGNLNAMNAAWGGRYGGNKVMHCHGAHKTMDSIREKAGNAFKDGGQPE